MTIRVRAVGSLLILLACQMNVSPVQSADPSKAAKTPVAKSHEQLGQLICEALDNEDYDTVQQLMIPRDLLLELKRKPLIKEMYDEYLKQLPKLAADYRHYLKREKLLPLKGRPIEKFETSPLNEQEINGKKIVSSSGVRLTDANGKIILELIDQAVSIDGQWYIARLCIEDIEVEIKKAAK